jgi:hypothetical protein
MIAHGRTPMIDHAAAVALLRRTVLPEIVTHPRTSAPMRAQKDGTSQMFGPRK